MSQPADEVPEAADEPSSDSAWSVLSEQARSPWKRGQQMTTPPAIEPSFDSRVVGIAHYLARHMPCADCGADTIDERYMVDHELWERFVGWRECGDLNVYGPGSAYLCVGCLEGRIGRRLAPDDFIGCPLNVERRGWSARLLNRIDIQARRRDLADD